MKSTKTWFCAAMLACLVLVASLIGCQSNLSDGDIDRIVDRMVQNPAPLDEDAVNRLVDAMLSHPKYLQYLENDEGLADSMVDALMAHPKYLEYLQDDEWVEVFTNTMMAHPMYQTRPEEDCATVILMASVISGEYTLPPESEVDTLCAWFANQLN